MDGKVHLGDAAAEGLGALAAAEVDQVEAAATTKEGRCGRGGGVQAENIVIVIWLAQTNRSTKNYSKEKELTCVEKGEG